MKYGCLNHTSFASCAVDQANWCTWHEDRSRCEMSYDDADFVHLLLWSRTRIACSNSKLEQLVTCSYITVDTDCTGQCAWAQGACYPTWYASIVDKPQSIQFFKRQVGCTAWHEHHCWEEQVPYACCLCMLAVDNDSLAHSQPQGFTITATSVSFGAIASVVKGGMITAAMVFFGVVASAFNETVWNNLLLKQ